MNGFTDLHVALGRDAAAPTRERLGNTWNSLAQGDEGVWIGAAVSDRSHPLTSASAGGWCLWANGPIFSYRDDEHQPLERFADDVLAERAEPSRLDMHAVIFGWHGPSRRLSVWTDRMGTVHAYTGGRPGQAAVGTFSLAVAERSSRELDWVGITGFCGFGFYPGDRTMFDDVRILRPATRSDFDDRGTLTRQTRYWDWWYDPDRSRSDDDFIDEFHDVWTRTVQRQLRGTRSVVPLSGGLDSRTLFAAAAPVRASVDHPVRTLTYGYSPKSVEIRIARKVATARGHTAQEHVIQPYLFDRMSEVVDAVEGFGALSLTRQVSASDLIASLGDHVLGGHWGDVWFDTAGASSGSTSDPADAAYEKFAKRGRDWLFRNLCNTHLQAPPDEVLRQVLAEEFDRIPVLDDADMQLKALKTEQWSFRWTLASVRAYQLAVPTLMPFYANAVVDFFLRVPSERLPGRRLQTAYLRRHHPDLARITWQDSGMSLYERPWEPTLALGRRALAKGLRTLRREQVIERNWEVQYLGGSRPDRLQDLLRSSVPGTAGLSSTDVQGFIDTFLQAPDGAQGYALDALLTLSRARGSGTEPHR